MTLVTSFMWIGLSVFRAFSERPEPVVPSAVIERLIPTLDGAAIEKIKNRIFLTEGEIPQTQIQSTPIATPSPTPTQAPVETASSTSSPSPLSTQEGGIQPSQ